MEFWYGYSGEGSRIWSLNHDNHTYNHTRLHALQTSPVPPPHISDRYSNATLYTLERSAHLDSPTTSKKETTQHTRTLAGQAIKNHLYQKCLRYRLPLLCSPPTIAAAVAVAITITTTTPVKDKKLQAPSNKETKKQRNTRLPQPYTPTLHQAALCIPRTIQQQPKSRSGARIPKVENGESSFYL